MYKRILSTLAICLAFGSAQAADPIMSVVTPTISPLSFEEYTGTTPVGMGHVDSNTVYFIDEQTGALGKSWYIFFEPLSAQSLSATFTFDSAIIGVFSTTTDLDASNAAYGAAGITYGHSLLAGLDRSDSFSISGNVLTLNLRTLNPGDHIRIFTAPAAVVPEPATYLLLAVSLIAVGFVARRRKP